MISLVFMHVLEAIVGLATRSAKHFLKEFALGYHVYSRRLRRTQLDRSQVVFDLSIIGLTVITGIAQAIV